MTDDAYKNGVRIIYFVLFTTFCFFVLSVWNLLPAAPATDTAVYCYINYDDTISTTTSPLSITNVQDNRLSTDMRYCVQESNRLRQLDRQDWNNHKQWCLETNQQDYSDWRVCQHYKENKNPYL